jgi:hypothetical protein
VKLLSSLRSLILGKCEWYISEISSIWEKRDISERISQVPWVGFWDNTRRYTFNTYDNYETTFEYFKWRREDRRQQTADIIEDSRQRTADMELENLL